MELVARLRAWSYARQHLGEPTKTIGQALNGVVAVYATHPTGPLALRARTSSFTPAAYRRLDAERSALRFPAMRKSVFLVPKKSAARIFTAVRPSKAHALRPLKRHGLDEKEYEKLARRILAAATEPLSKSELEGSAGISGAELGTVLRCLRYEGRLLNLAGESLSMSPHRFVATTSWVPQGLDAGDVDAARGWLAGEYLRAFGPARVADFAWWTGLTKTQAKKAMESQETVDLDDGLLLLKDYESEFDRVKAPRNTVTLLPRWDSYTMGHAPDGRQRFVHPSVQKKVYTPIGVGLPGDGNPVALVDGEAVATWTYSRKEGPDVQPFETLPPKIRKKVDVELDAIAGLLGN